MLRTLITLLLTLQLALSPLASAVQVGQQIEIVLPDGKFSAPYLVPVGPKAPLEE